ncbi:UDP-glucose 4-epimerase GalE [Bacteriovorax sp. Seq25_V]|uniref:UDP-glucose 4-epimerase GalE n=1 Tax=Bacteriovorax sp. Seq25_V TaxID=1201288 RepID=UPI00038A558C|nr:UDP-glucose 4-epimerase GalE [Bacteriovorax sp. Seq25_V]EQC43498.1 UDP-glucose 4-epimerase [Bacteriovorax sp. Seq25_V]
MAKILLTGGAGYIGSHVLNLLGLDGSHEITILDNLSTGRKESVLFGELIIENLENTDAIDKLFKEKNFDACLHFAGSIVVPESVSNPIKYYDNNTKNTYELLKICHKYGVNNFIFSSTAAVYGNTPDGICSEETAATPLNPYGKTKYMTEWMLEDFSHAYPDFNYVIFRYFNVAGANIDLKIGQCTPDATHLIKIAAQTIVGKREKMAIFGDDYNTPDGTCIRDYIHVDDLAQAHVDGLNYLLKGGKSTRLNCGYGHGYSVKEVIATMKKVSGIDFKVEMAPRRDGDAEKLISKALKIRDVIGWVPKYDDLETICKTALEWEKKI